MTSLLILALLFIGLVGAAVASIIDPMPLRRPPEWSVGALMDQRR